MSDRDSFIDEVSEELRRDRMLRLWRRWAPFVIGGVVAAVAAAGISEWLESRREASAASAGAAISTALSELEAADRAAALEQAAEQIDGPASVVARLAAAGAHAEAGEAAAAEAELSVAASAQTPGLAPWAEFARFKSFMLREPDMTPETRVAELDPFVTEGGALRLMALERRAMAHRAAGDAQAALADVEAILADPLATAGLRERASRLAEVLESGR